MRGRVDEVPRLMSERDVIIVGDDSHHPEEAGLNLGRAADLLRTLSYREIAGLRQKAPPSAPPL